MCDDLNEELNSAKSAATRLAEHLHEMCSPMAILPVVVEGLDYEITTRRNYPANTKMTHAKVTELRSDGVIVLSTGRKLWGGMDADGAYVESGLARLYIRVGDAISYV
jgi:hypothetical protein